MVRTLAPHGRFFGEHVTVDEQVAFSRNFGELEGDVGTLVKSG
jgi:hypothetical protein